MKRILSANVAGHTLLVALGLLALFHILVLLQVVPATIVWGGRAAAAPGQLVVLELVALAVTALFALTIAAKLRYFDAGALRRVVAVGAWVIVAYLLLNTLGNLTAPTFIERLLFMPLALLLTACAWRLAIEP